MKSFRPKDGSGEPPSGGRNAGRDFRGERRSNETPASTTDPDARLLRKGEGREARLVFMDHVLMENRNGFAVDGEVTRAPGAAEPLVAIEMATPWASASRSAPTRRTTPRDSSWSAARKTSSRVWPGTSPAPAARPSTDAPAGIPAMCRASK